jgi:hypothetical protein
MKKTFNLILIVISFNLQGQDLPKTFKIGSYLEVLNNDSIKVYLNCTGTVVDKSCASFYRIGRLDSIHVNFSGVITDYYLDGKKALVASISDDYFNGKATYFHENGETKSVGNYNQDIKTGVWTYYYDNGQIEKIINYIKGYSLITDSYKKNGKQKVMNGNGDYRGEFYSNKSCSPFEIWGPVKDGKMNGKWTFYNPMFNQKLSTEVYEDGKFIKGFSPAEIYKDYPRILIDGYCANENVHLEDNMLGCPGDKGIFWLEYKESSLHKSFYPDLKDSLELLVNKRIKDQWFIIGIKINNSNELIEVNVKSSINDALIEKKIGSILESMNGFKSAKMEGKPIDFDLFFTIMIRDNQFIIPTDYLYHNR